MLKSHVNLIEPRPSDRLQVGDRVVDVVLREVTPLAGGDTTRITLKSLDVLLVLVAHAGKVVGREALLEWVWPDTLPTDDVVTQAITQLRRALGDERGKPRQIETIAKRGYRLLAPVQWLPDAPVPGIATPQTAAAIAPAAPLAAGESAAGAGKSVRIAGLSIALALIAAVAVFAWHRQTGAPARGAIAASPAAVTTGSAALPFQRITSLPLDEAWPNLSPDGSLVAYSRYSADGEGAALMLQTTAALPPRQLTEAVTGRIDLFPAWSPDGREVAFVRSEKKRCAVMAVSAAGGDPRELAECPDGAAHSLRWYPDGKALLAGGIVTPGGAGGGDLRRLDLNNGRWTPLRYARSPTDMDLMPSVSPDGRWIVFQRNISLGDLWRIPVTGGVPERLTTLRTNIYGSAWLPDGRSIVFGKYVDGRILLSRLDLVTRRISEYGIDVDTIYPSVAARTGAIVFVVRESRSVMWRVRVPRATATATNAEEDELFPTTATNLLPSVAPDGKQLVFVSDRTGDSRLWWADMTRPDSLRSIDGLLPVPRHAPSWSADSQRVLVIGREQGRNALYEVQPQAGRMERLPDLQVEPVFAAYAADPARLYVVADQGAGRLGLTLYDRSTQPWRALASLDNVAMLLPDPARQRVLVTRVSDAGLWAASSDLRGAQQISERPARIRGNLLALDAGRVRMLAYATDCPLSWISLTPPDPAQDRCLGRRDRMLDGLTYDAARATVYFSAEDGAGGDLGWIAPEAAFAGAVAVQH